ncbi:MAG TPA: pilus assembly protein [Actinotalea sp.]|jgi:Na+-transporting methylmalonyl-CoA/oxaloacetate decarboxylase gamma subunit
MTPAWTARAARSVVASARDRARARGPQGGSDDGSAIVEFLGAGLVLLVPLVYLVLVMGRLQAASFAVDGAAREAVRAAVASPDDETALRRATAAVALTIADQGFAPEEAGAALSLDCSATPCSTPDSTVEATVELRVALPLVPGWLQDVVPLRVPVNAHATGQTDTFADRGAGGA